ncbi:MAG: F0F1 ATP synthase subunit gamma, partial [Puia sp.]
YETAVSALGDYYHTVALGIIAYFNAEKIEAISEKKQVKKNNESTVCAIVFGSDQGLVARFNDSIADFVTPSLKVLPGKKEIWCIGERVQFLLSDAGLTTAKLYPVPNDVNAITPLVTEILKRSQDSQDKEDIQEFYIFHNKPKPGGSYTQVKQRFLPLDEKWKETIQETQWPTKLPPQVAGDAKATLTALINSYLFTSLFKACIESLASENASRLDAMQRAEKNISDLLDDLTKKYHRLRQSSIDEELFDVVSGFEALNDKKG